MEQLEAYTFTLKHKKGQENKVVDALSRRVFLIEEIQLQSIGIDALKNFYEGDQDFGEALKGCTKLIGKYHTYFYEYIIQNDLLFKGSQLCIPRFSMRLNIIKEKHHGSMGGHFEIDKTTKYIKRSFYWPKMSNDIKKFVEGCTIC